MVVLSSGVIGKVTKVEDAELGIEIATGVVVKVVRSMVSEVRARAGPPTTPSSPIGARPSLMNCPAGR